MPLMAQAEFQKISAFGDKLPSDAKEWSCVYDTTTNLLWETATTPSNDITWYSSNALTPGEINNGKNTQAYVNEHQGSCGFNDWRLPTASELGSVVLCPQGHSDWWVDNFSCKNFATDNVEPQVNTTYFPHVKGSYWSSVEYDTIPTSAYFVNFYNGATDRGEKWLTSSVMMVRTGWTKPVIGYPVYVEDTGQLSIPKFFIQGEEYSVNLYLNTQTLKFTYSDLLKH